VDKQAVWDAVRAWPQEDQLDLVFRLWDHIADSGWQPELTDELKAELDRRWAAYEADPTNVLSWEQIVESIRTNDLARRLHGRATRGEVLSADEQAQLDRWYGRHDQKEAAALAKARPAPTVADVQRKLS
jgi:putative addiction module component (TIGR02574 family)